MRTGMMHLFNLSLLINFALNKTQSVMCPSTWWSTWHVKGVNQGVSSEKKLRSRKQIHQGKSVTGTSTKNKYVKSVATSRSVDVLVSRLDPGTTDEDLNNCVQEMKGDIKVFNITCNRLKSKFEALYS